MDQGHESKRPRLSTGPPSWPAGPSHHGHGVSLPHPGPSLSVAHHPQPPSLPPPTSSQYSPSPHLSHPPHPFPPRPQEYAPPHQQPPPPQHFDDRRQHEPERYPPIQDPHHQPPPSPAHQPYPNSGYHQPPNRDTMVKREADDVTLPQLRRPNSTGTGPEQPLPPPPPHGVSHTPGHIDERRHMSYDSGPPPQMYRHPTYPPPPQTPLSHPAGPPTPYEQTSMYGPPPMGPDGPYPITYAAASGKRKSQRASQACESCRQLKAKCDENKPCKNCTDKNITCSYRDPAPKQQDKATQDILDSMQKIMQTYDQKWVTRFETVTSELQELRGELRGGSAHSMQGPVPRGLLSLHVKEEHRVTSPQPLEFEDTLSSSPSDGAANGAPDPQSAAKRMRILENEEENEEPPGKPVQPQPPPFPHDHTTPAGRLLTWPSIRAIVAPLLDSEGIKYIDNYPQRLEESRGQLPLFGRGEGSHSRAVERDTTFDYVDMADDISVGDHPSPSGGTDWGPIGGLSPPGGIPNDLRTQVARTDGALDFDVQKVWSYVEAYKNHIQNMHPLIPPEDLSALVATFLEEVGAKKQRVAKFTSQQDAHAQQGLDHDRKRKRSPAPNGVETAPPQKRLKPQRSVNHALVLLVLALGKICQWRDRKLPDVPEREATNSGSPLVRNGHVTSPNQGSPPSSSISQSPGLAALSSPKEHERTAASRRSSMQAPTSAASPAPPRKNYEIIPGLEYFAYATDILGNQFGSYRLTYIQAHILACLYYGQLGRVIASFRHIRFACQSIIDKLQPSMERLRQFTAVEWSGHDNTAPRKLDGVTDNKLLIAFWSCCQLESDILAELNLVPSGILQYENLLPYPNLPVMRSQLGFSDAVAYSYAAQLYLRKRLNKISGSLYDPNKMLKASEQRAVLAEIEEDLLNNSHVWLGLYKFDVNDPPAGDILSARIRAKFWGANVITYRPSIKEVLDFSYKRYNKPQPEPQPSFPGRTVTGWPSVPEDARTPSDIDPVVFDNAKKGVEAIMKSTSAFHGLEDKRFVITNVFGTAHAQWGNLITLATVYQDPVLGKFVDEGDLRHLLKKTIEFFEIVAQESSSLAVDLRVLQGLSARLPSKEELNKQWNMISPMHVDSPAIMFAPLNGPTPHSAPGRSPITPGEMTPGQPTPMGY